MNDTPSSLTAAYDAPYDEVSDYDATRRADPELVETLATHLALFENGHYLDIGCGTGNYTHALADRAGHWTGIDPSARMINKARQKRAHEKPITIKCQQAAAEQLPFAEAQFDGIVSVLALHHMRDLVAAFGEMRRVLKPQGRLVVFGVLPHQVRANWLTHYFPRMMEQDAKGLPDETQIAAAVRYAGFQMMTPQPFFVTRQTQDRFFFSGKYRPEIYLAASARENMSPFRNAANADEVEDGLAALARDIASGAIDEIIAANDRQAAAQSDDVAGDGPGDVAGEYCFLTFTPHRPGEAR